MGMPEQYCMMPAPDEGKACKRASDCEDVCMAETHTCSRLGGVGEFDILDAEGKRATMAVD